MNGLSVSAWDLDVQFDQDVALLPRDWQEESHNDQEQRLLEEEEHLLRCVDDIDDMIGMLINAKNDLVVHISVKEETRKNMWRRPRQPR